MLGEVVQAYNNPNTWKKEAGKLRVWHQPGLYNKILS